MERLFLTVLHMGINAGYLILAVAAARFLLKRAPKSMICMLWMVVGLRLLCPFHIETAFGVLPEQADSYVYQMYAQNPAAQGQTMSKASAAAEPDTKPAETVKAASENKNPVSKMITAAAWIWFIGIILMSAYLVFSWLRVRKKVAAAVPAESDGIRFYQCEHISSPFLFGLAAPKIYVPFSACGQELSYVLKHEQAHKSRYDHLAKFAGYLLLSAYWFQPLVWAAYLLFCRDIELACDERVVKEIGEDGKKAYSQALLACSASRRTAAACPVAFGEIGVKDRVKNILNYKKPGFKIIFAAVLVCMIVTVCFTTEAKRQRAPQVQAAVTESVTKYAEAFCSRDAKAIYEMLDDAGRTDLMEQGMLEGTHSFGWSSPWPWGGGGIDGQPNYRIVSADETSAEILYYAWVSDPHITVWNQVITYQYSDEKKELAIHDVSSEILDSIHTAEQFYKAYPNGAVSGSRMDYYQGNGAGEALRMNAQTRDDLRILYQPYTAALFLLNIQDDPSVVKTDVSDINGETIVTFTFLEDGSSASVKMIQPLGEDDIWVPQTDEFK